MRTTPLLHFLGLYLTGCKAFTHFQKSPTSTRPLASTSANDQSQPTSVVIVGGGWAGFSAADALARSNNNLQITLLDASPRGKGGLAGGWRTPKGRPVEAGIHGFWREYKNTFQVLKTLNLDLDDVLTPYTPSALYSKNGKVAVAPVLKDDFDESSQKPSLTPWRLAQILQSAILSTGDDKKALKPLAALLPVPLDLALLADFNPTSPLTAVDRVSAIGLLGAWADFGQESQESWDLYDSLSAEDLFLSKAGITPQLYEELVLPMLHVLPMCPGWDCSAAAALSCFHVFALQSQGAFDVRWCRGAIAETIFNPWAEQLTAMGVNIQGSAKIVSIERNDQGFQLSLERQEVDPLTCDALIMAVGSTAMGRLAPLSPAFEKVPIDFGKNRGVTCVAVRLFLKPHGTITSGLKGGQYDSTEAPPDIAQAMRESPVAVCGPDIGGIPELRETGFCIYDLQRMHDEFSITTNENRTAVLEVDFFRADTIADLDDDKEVASLAIKAIASTFKTDPISMHDVVDLAIVRARKAVSHFATNSASYSPPVKLETSLYMSGDWIDRSGHASWSTEKAVVTGRQAARTLLNDRKMKHSIEIIPAAPDTPYLQALRGGAKALRSIAPPPGDGVPPSPWSFVKSLLERNRI